MVHRVWLPLACVIPINLCLRAKAHNKLVSASFISEPCQQVLLLKHTHTHKSETKLFRSSYVASLLEEGPTSTSLQRSQSINQYNNAMGENTQATNTPNLYKLTTHNQICRKTTYWLQDFGRYTCSYIPSRYHTYHFAAGQ